MENSKSILFKAAWSYIKSGMVSNMSEALKLAWKYIKMKSILRTELVHIAFRKVDGTIRTALATTNPEITNYLPSSNTKPRKSNYAVVRFYDTMIGQWRSFKLQNLIIQ